MLGINCIIKEVLLVVYPVPALAMPKMASKQQSLNFQTKTASVSVSF